MIRQNKNIKGIFIGETELKISQSANDTEIMLQGNENACEETIQAIDTYGGENRVSS